MYYYRTLIADYCTVMQNCDTVQSSCDNDLQGMWSCPAFRLKGSKFLQTALSHFHALLVAPGNGSQICTNLWGVQSSFCILSADQNTSQITDFGHWEAHITLFMPWQWDGAHVSSLSETMATLWLCSKRLLTLWLVVWHLWKNSFYNSELSHTQ